MQLVIDMNCLGLDSGVALHLQQKNHNLNCSPCLTQRLSYVSVQLPPYHPELTLMQSVLFIDNIFI